MRGVALSPSTFSPSSGGSFQTTPSPTGFGGTPSPVAFSPMTPGAPYTPQTPGAGNCIALTVSKLTFCASVFDNEFNEESKEHFSILV